MREFAGKTAIATDGASGIGLGMAKVFGWVGIPGLVGSPIYNEAP